MRLNINGLIDNTKSQIQKLYQDRSEEQEKTRLPGTLSYTESREAKDEISTF